MAAATKGARGMNTYELIMAANAVAVLDSPGDYFRLLDSTAVCDVQLTRAGIPRQESKQVLAGLWMRPAGGFTGVRITNGATAQTVKIGIASGEAGYDRLQVSGGLAIQQGSIVTDAAPVSVGTTATLLISAAESRKGCRFTNAGTVDIYVGGSGVTVANGAIKIAPGATWIERDAAPAAWYGISGTAGQSVRIQTVS